MNKALLAELLRRYHTGAANAVTARELESLFGVRGKELRDAVNSLRRGGVPIASSGQGYFYAASAQEVRSTIIHMTRRISGISAAIRGLSIALGQFDDSQLRLPLQDPAQNPAPAVLRGGGDARERCDASPTGGAERSGLCVDESGDDA